MNKRRLLFIFLVLNCGSVFIFYNLLIRPANKVPNVGRRDFLKEVTNKVVPTPSKKKYSLELLPIKESVFVSKLSQSVNKTLRPFFNYTLQPVLSAVMICTGICSNNSEIRWKMVMFVKSATFNFKKRAKVRETWGSHKQVRQAAISVVFVTGTSNNASINKQIIDEHYVYGDILQYDGPDDYSNITLKTLAGMQWASFNLPKDSLYSSADDDFIVITESLVTAIDDNLAQKKEKDWPEFPLICGFVKGKDEKPVRFGDPKFSKWAVSKESYRWTEFPVYCHGGLYTTSVNVVKQLYDLSRFETILRLDDVWMTGILRWKLGMPDSMVVAPKNPIGFHLESYKEPVGTYLKNTLREIVETFYLKYETPKVCKCSL